MSCKNLCLRIQAKPKLGSPYRQGLKRCTTCECWLDIDARCPCCGKMLRCRPVKHHYKHTGKSVGRPRKVLLELAPLVRA